MASLRDNIKSLRERFGLTFRFADTLKRLLIINVAIFLIIRIVNAISSLFLTPIFSFNDVSAYIAIPAHFDQLIRKPWTIFTYMFFHWDILHIFFNMLWLYVFGRIYQEYLGSRKLLGTYILGGLTGAAFFVMAFNFFPLFRDALPGAFALGASASVLAITVAAATLLPEHTLHLFLFGPVRLKWIALVTILLDLINVSGANAGGHIAHLGGALFGFIYIKQLQKGRDLAGWLIRLFDRLSGKPRMRVTTQKGSKKDDEYNINRKAKQERMDDILDKINKSGYGSLTQSEKDFLFQISKEN